MGKYFGTDGFRGEANLTLTADHAFQIGRFIGFYHKKGKKAKILIGKDTRLSGYMLEYALAAGITASGGDGYLLHVTTTPSVSHIARTENFDCGVMISASHNLFSDNGIKLMDGNGEKMTDEMTEAIERFLDGKGPDIPFAKGAAIGRTIDFSAGRNRYIGYLISLATHSLRGMRIGLDCANGSTWMIARAVFDALGAETHVISDQPNGLNINDHCGSTYLAPLRKLVKEKGLDVGFAFDGDGDRCLAVDEKGNTVDGDQILYLYASYMKKREKLISNTVVSTVMSNMGLGKALEREGILWEQTKVGDRFVYECMQKGGHLLGGEQSGHIIFAKYAATGDGLLTAIKIMQAMMDQEKPLSKLTAPLQLFPQETRSVRVKDQIKALEHPAVQKTLKAAEQALQGKGRALLRKSGTEPVIRILTEAEEESLCIQWADALEESLKHAEKKEEKPS